MAIPAPCHLWRVLDPASAEVIAKREIRVTTKIIDNNFFPIETPSFQLNHSIFTPLEIILRCSAAGLHFRIIPAGSNAPLEFLTGIYFLDERNGGFIQALELLE
jgi:hypothetical protein